MLLFCCVCAGLWYERVLKLPLTEEQARHEIGGICLWHHRERETHPGNANNVLLKAARWSSGEPEIRHHEISLFV